MPDNVAAVACSISLNCRAMLAVVTWCPLSSRCTIKESPRGLDTSVAKSRVVLNVDQLSLGMIWCKLLLSMPKNV